MSQADPIQGRFDGPNFLFPVRVYYEDTDFSGVVYHANYLRFMERGRSEFLRAAGLRHEGLLKAEEPLVWAVRRMQIDFAKPARVDDALTVTTRVTEVTGARMVLAQRVTREDMILVAASVEACVLTLEGRPRRMPDTIRNALNAYLV
jgi:acyl-CoA thioester hydrolase